MMVDWESKCKEYEVVDGRMIVCKDNGKEVVGLTKEDGFTPTEADAMTHYLADKLNKGKDFNRYYNRYMKS